jgi:hypothetical protein
MPKLSFDEWKNSKYILENILGDEVQSCSVPGGDISNLVYKTASEAGYKFIFNSEPSTSLSCINESFIFGRFSIKKDHSLKKVQNILEGRNHSFLRFERKVKRYIKKFLAPWRY